FLVKNQISAPATNPISRTAPVMIATSTIGLVLRFLALRFFRLAALGASSGTPLPFLDSSEFFFGPSSSSRAFFFRGSSSPSAAPAWTTFSSQGNTCSHLGHSISESGSGATGRRSLALHSGQ